MRTTKKVTTEKDVAVIICDGCGKKCSEANSYPCDFCGGDYCVECHAAGRYFDFGYESPSACKMCTKLGGKHAEAIEATNEKAEDAYEEHMDAWKEAAQAALYDLRIDLTKEVTK